MASLYDPASLGIKAPTSGFQEGGWYDGRQYWGGKLSDPGVINPLSNQTGAGQAVSPEVNAQSAKAQGVSADQLTSYLQDQAKKSASVRPTSSFSAPGPQAAPTGSASGMSSMLPTLSTAQNTVNLPELYKSLTEGSGVKQKQEEYSNLERQFIDAKGKINDNPFLSEADRVGRVEKLTQQFNERTANIRNDIATAKADVETQLNLQTKQLDINSNAVQQALNLFNTLLDSGALDSASGEDIAGITRSTGLSSSVIQSAINSRALNNLKTTTQTFDDGTNEGFIIYTLDQNGNVVNQSRQVTGRSSKSGSFDTAAFLSSLMGTSGNSADTPDISSIWSEE